MLPTRVIVALVCALGSASAVLAEVHVEYIGHASFVVESPAGTRVVIDPFSSTRWLGYRYPDNVAADAVLVTHPHYDHDASYYWGDSVPVFREPGRYRVGDVEVVGVRGKHADPYGKDFEQKNTVWRVEAGGVRIIHVGDNGPLTEENFRELGPVDVLMVPADAQDHILGTEAITTMRAALGDPLVVPMHYRLDGFLGLPTSLGPIGPWLEKQDGVARLDSNRATLTAAKDPSRRVVVFQPSPELEVWSEELTVAWQSLGEAQQIMANHPNQLSAAAMLVQKAAESSDAIVFGFQWARVLVQSGKTTEAVTVLERSLARGERDDWEFRMRARDLLAGLYLDTGDRKAAETQYRIVLANSYRTELLEKARAFLAAP